MIPKKKRKKYPIFREKKKAYANSQLENKRKPHRVWKLGETSE